jgi:hypothetical protein
VLPEYAKDENSNISFYVVPSKVVAHVCKRSHECWLEIPSVNGKERGKTEIRRLLPQYKLPFYLQKKGYKPTKHHQKFLKEYGEGWMEKYRNAWNLLAGKI